ncbi:MAG TPA: hypothetical protein VHE81_15090 [Lacipirellulaceae bacterium]|nr:hypothetical protein [Lacipirellulaceae bacterium]
MNAVIAVIYLLMAAKWWWLPSELADIPGASGGSPFIWLLVSCYTLAPVALLNLGFLARHIYVYAKRKEPWLSRAALASPLIWIVAVYVDFLHH